MLATQQRYCERGALHHSNMGYDMLYEKFGWTLNFWNIAGVPYLYCFQLYYVLKNQSRLDEQQSRRSICNAFPIYWSLYAYGYESLY